jgi:hypothetical protein
MRSAILATTLLLATQAIADPLEDLLDKGNGGACFERVYDEAHLAQNPKQRTRTALLSLKAIPDRFGAIVRIRFQRTDGVLYIAGTCDWAERANLDGDGKPLIAAFRGPAGLDCHAVTSVDGGSAEEGGDFPVDLRDGAAIVAYMPPELAAWRSLDRSAPAGSVVFGPDDNAFRLTRTGTGTCRGLVDDLLWID